MKSIDTRFFQKFNFQDQQVKRYWENALKDLGIAKKDPILEVKFTYSYQALIKTAITLLAKHQVKVRSVPGHHVRLLEYLSELLKEPKVLAVGNVMRSKRNIDLYGEGEMVTEKEVEDCLAFVSEIVEKARGLMGSKF
ncbi:MAG: hypothetical protein HYS22_02625 [Deltaproteobacteria bacterium]|nr:hypothetical protein [Deltaproteobacteria bacterium]